MDVDPDPNGTNRVFAVPDSRLVEASLAIYLDGIVAIPIDVDAARGAFEIEAPDEGQKLVASYYFQWFTDDQLDSFLQDGAQLLNYEGVEDSAMPTGIRTPLVSLGAYYAYMSKAAEAAPALVASSSGFTSDTSKEHPYWMALAKMAYEMFEKELKTFTQDPTAGAKPAIKFVSYGLHRYDPRS